MEGREKKKKKKQQRQRSTSSASVPRALSGAGEGGGILPVGEKRGEGVVTQSVGVREKKRGG